jgi:hypothetical protein
VGEPMQKSHSDPKDEMAFNLRIGAQLSILAAVAFLGGCSAAEPDEKQDTGERRDEAAAATGPESSPPARGTAAERLTQLVEQSREDLASKLGVDAAAITVAEARHVVWPDGSAGCPAPGYDYMQMQTEGLLIRLKANGRIFQYHAGTAGPAVHCAKPSSVDPPSKFEER